MISFKKYLFALFTAQILLAGLAPSETAAALRPGYYHASIYRADGNHIVFNFQAKDSAGKQILYVINGTERLLVDDIKSHSDSVFIQMPFFESSFKAKILKNGDLKGEWIKKYGHVTQILPFSAAYNVRERFKTTAPPSADITGRWAADFVSKNNDTSHLVGEFVQKKSHLAGTFLDPTGDYRYLEGAVVGDSLFLSTFDGAHAYLFTAKIENDKTISGGRFFSGATSVESWKAVKNEAATLSDGFDEIKVKPGYAKMDFTFKNSEDGSPVSFNDDEFKNKVVIIQLMGSWCPNCMDETKFLSEYYNQHPQDVQIVGLAYERTTDFSLSQKALLPFKKKFNVSYPILITGVTVSDSLRAEKTLPQLTAINAFPTTIFVDKKGIIRKIHSGFSGPATGDHFTEFKKEFHQVVNSLIAEK